MKGELHPTSCEADFGTMCSCRLYEMSDLLSRIQFGSGGMLCYMRVLVVDQIFGRKRSEADFRTLC